MSWFYLTVEICYFFYCFVLFCFVLSCLVIATHKNATTVINIRHSDLGIDVHIYDTFPYFGFSC